MATHSSVLVWKILWTEDPGGLQSMGSQRVVHDWVNNTFRLLCIEETEVKQRGKRKEGDHWRGDCRRPGWDDADLVRVEEGRSACAHDTCVGPRLSRRQYLSQSRCSGKEGKERRTIVGGWEPGGKCRAVIALESMPLHLCVYHPQMIGVGDKKKLFSWWQQDRNTLQESHLATSIP